MSNPSRETLACLIIDDPLLKPRYGCLTFETLLAEMKDHRFFTEIAFIPYNWRRSSPVTTKLLLDNQDYIRLCVHGCNHSSNEFGQGSLEHLHELSSVALSRMERHKQLTGLEYDRVMVFPRGQFSVLAMLALRQNGYIAAINSSLHPMDGDKPASEEFKRPATRVFSDVPLFLRRHPRQRQAIQQDIDNGRPVLLAAHHSDFINGYEVVTDTVDWINRQGNVRWVPLADIVAHYCGAHAPDLTAAEFLSRPTSPYQLMSSKVMLRNFLMQFRDNYIETNEFLKTLYAPVARVLESRKRKRAPGSVTAGA